MTEIGSDDDRVRVKLADGAVRVVESYEVKMGVLEQPCAFSVRMGHSDVIRKLAQQYRPNTPFELAIGDVPQFKGTTDGWIAEEGDGAELSLRGRDYLKRLTDDDVSEAISLKDVTYPGL